MCNYWLRSRAMFQRENSVEIHIDTISISSDDDDIITISSDEEDLTLLNDLDTINILPSDEDNNSHASFNDGFGTPNNNITNSNLIVIEHHYFLSQMNENCYYGYTTPPINEDVYWGWTTDEENFDSDITVNNTTFDTNMNADYNVNFGNEPNLSVDMIDDELHDVQTEIPLQSVNELLEPSTDELSLILETIQNDILQSSGDIDFNSDS